jgi:hypothetical protein
MDREAHPVLNLSEQKSGFRIRPTMKLQMHSLPQDRNHCVYTMDRTYHVQDNIHTHTYTYPISFVPDKYKNIHTDEYTPSIRTASENIVPMVSRPENIIYAHTQETQEIQIREYKTEHNSVQQRIYIQEIDENDTKKSILENPRYSSTENVD